MTALFSVEVGEDEKQARCECCGEQSKTAHGFVYKGHEPYAVYYAAWADVHSERGVAFAIAIGKWDNTSSSGDRACFGLTAHEGEHEVVFRIVNPEESPWGSTELLGNMPPRQEALKHPLLKELYEVADVVMRHHPVIRDYLGLSM